ncbi:MAG TPA: pirin family protein [Kiloniellales bacterium]|nr:pirin family protein [Kiloniellales bacterium]
MSEKRVRRILRTVEGVPTSDGAGVRLRRMIGTPQCDEIDPFLMLDEFRNERADDYIAGFPEHPHRGFETVTYMIRGRMRHRDSVGNSGLLSDGAVQWMTAGRGIVHSEMPEQTDGLLWGYQLWVNLPAELKMTAPRYQDIPAERIPEVARDGATVRVIAGTYDGETGAAETLIPVTYLDVALEPSARFETALENGAAAFIHVVSGRVLGTDHIDREAEVPAGHLAVLEREGAVRFRTGAEPGRFLLIAGRPIGEPVARMGPFVMNTRAELQQAVQDYHAGRLGR